MLRRWRYRNSMVYLLHSAVMACMLAPVAYADRPDPGDVQQLIRKAEAIPGMIEENRLETSQIPDPHWRKQACLACHTSEPAKGAPLLKTGGDGSCFYCHRPEDHTVIHPARLEPGKRMRAQMSPEFRQRLIKGRKTDCLTCHDILLQCKKRPAAMRVRNSAFLRGGYYKHRTGVCYQCHNRESYQKLNPHDQVSDQGVLNKDKCLICHRKLPRQDGGRVGAGAAMHTDPDWSAICLNCHRWQPHPGGNMAMFSGGKAPDHLVVPDDGIRDRLATRTRELNLDMPLEPDTGKVYCATCHNPHERGVIKKAGLAKGADEKNRLRAQRICINCHEK